MKTDRKIENPISIYSQTLTPLNIQEKHNGNYGTPYRQTSNRANSPQTLECNFSIKINACRFGFSENCSQDLPTLDWKHRRDLLQSLSSKCCSNLIKPLHRLTFHRLLLVPINIFHFLHLNTFHKRTVYITNLMYKGNVTTIG